MHRLSEAEEPKPTLQRFFEAVAAVMGLTDGLHTLELRFESGHLVRYYLHQQHVKPDGLGVFDQDVERLLGVVP
jgi:hypothetical protein